MTDLERAVECTLVSSPSFLANIDAAVGLAEALLVHLDLMDHARSDGV